MANIYFGKLSKNTNPNQFKNHFIQATDKWMSDIQIGDYAFVAFKGQISLWKNISKNPSNNEFRWDFEPIYSNIDINTKKFRNLKGLIINSSLVLLQRQSAIGFNKLIFENNFDSNTFINIQYLQNTKNYRNIKLIYDKNDINPNSSDIQLFINNDTIELIPASFIAPETITKFKDWRKERNGSHKSKDKIFEKIDTFIKNKKEILDVNDLPIADLYDAFFCEYTNKTEEEIEEDTNEITMTIEDYAQLLSKTKNLILHGAPGTGKTYLAHYIAKIMNATVNFVQFHPSYDYTDFVEGLRPVKNENDTTVTFEKIDGIFKQFCEKALLSASVKGGTDNFEESYSLLLEKIEKENYVEVETMTKSSKFKVELNEYENGLATRTYPNDEYKKGEWLAGHSRFYTKEQLYNIYRGLPGVPKGGHDNYRKAIIKYMKDNLKLQDYVPGTTEKQDKKFVFIIDEINRGELSKIFGELFYSIDPGYRVDISQLSKENLPVTIKTQYSNMQNEPNEFDIVLGEQEDFDHFFIPDNVYIIGTMNDIDRSVESMDFAFRRRFTFKEITAKDTQETILSVLDENTRKEAIKRMDSLNYKIWHKPEENESYENRSIEGLSSAYHIGGAYFLKLKDLDDDFEALWDYHLEGLLREYLRGMEDAEELLKKLHKAYNLENQE